MKLLLSLFLLSITSLFAIAQEKPGWWSIPETNTNIKLGGYFKVDLIHDFNPIESPDFFDVSKIPTDGSEGRTTHLNSKETRLNLDIRTNRGSLDIRGFIEGDFYGSNGAFRLRHAFVELGDHWLAGQWWSNFMDENIIPPTLDFEKPLAYAFARHPMVRFKTNISPSAYVAVAFEEPSENAQMPSEPGTFYSPIPDVNARLRLEKDWGHLQFSGFIAQLTYQYDSGGKDDLLLSGGNVSGKIFVGEQRDFLIFQALYGPGIGRYRGGLSSGLDENGNIEALTDQAYTIGYRHYWSKELSSLFVYNHGSANNTEGQANDSINEVSYLATNIIWEFVPKTEVGMEYLYGMRVDKDTSSGTANRLQFSVKYIFN
jgi:hypothetical protein